MPGLFVISRNSAFTYKAQPVKVDEVGRDLGVRYVLEGSVQRADDRVRVSAQLTDASTGFQLWSDRYDRDLRDIFALQSEISEEILAALQLEIRDAEFERIRQKPTDSLTAYDLYLQAVHYVNLSTVEENLRGRRLLERAIELFERGRASNPDLILARVGLAVEYERAGRDDDAERVVREILEINPQITTDAVARLVPGLSSIMSKEELDDLKRGLRRAGLP